MMESDVIEYEKVQIGNWEGRLPSEICTNHDIFNEIFSLNTWKTVLTAEQRERIMQMLPPEVLSTPGAAQQTMEDLFGGTLTHFDSSPLDNLFQQLEQGHCQPEVVAAKAKIEKVWRKESLRRRKKYHLNLLQEVVVSQRTQFKRLFNGDGDDLKSLDNIPPSKKQKPKSQVKNEVVDGNLMNSNSKHKLSNGDDFSQLIRNRADKRFREEIEEANRISGCFSSSDDEISPMKKSKTAKAGKKGTNNTKAPSKKKAQTVKEPITVAPKKNSNSATNSKRGKGMNKNAVKQGKSTVETPKMNYIPEYPEFTKMNTSKVKVSIDSAINSRLQTPPPPACTNTAAVMPNPVKSSPILASQLQAPPNPLSNYNSSKLHSNISTSGNNVLAPSAKVNLNQVLNRFNEEKSSEDDLESSSDEFEFEFIEPSNFGVTPTSKKPASVTTAKAVSPRTPTGTVNSVKSKTGTQNNTNSKMTNSNTVSKSAAAASSKSNVNKGSQKPSSTTNTANSNTPGNKSKVNRVRPSAQSSPISSLPAPAPATATSLTSSPRAVNPPTTTTVLQNQGQKIVALNPTTLAQTVTRPFLKQQASLTPVGLSVAKNSVETPLITFNGTSASITGLSPILSINGPTHLTMNQISTSTASPIMSSHLSSLNLNMLRHNNPHNSNHHENSSCNLSDNDDLNLTSLGLSGLGNLGMGINMNLVPLDTDDGVDGSDVKNLNIDNMDKIDDLSSVLDANPFDSLPNLSDELDGLEGLDLDLVDGLCDFDSLLNEEKQYSSFFSLIRDVLCSTRDHRMTIVCLDKTVKKWSSSQSATMNPWFIRVSDWNEALSSSLNFLAGNYQDVHPEDFVPYIEYKYKTKYYQWIGAGRDSDNNLTPLCLLWMDNLDRLPTLKKLEGDTEDVEEEDDENEDSDVPGGEEAKKKCKRPQTPPPPRCVTDWTVRASTQEEKTEFQLQERVRFDNPHKAFTYRMHGYESVVGPVKGVYSSQSGMTNKARGHSLLVDDRPPYVTILALVRDAVARLPNGEGTRSEICEMLRDSAFLAPEASSVTLNSVVSGALDRLHYERDPCVRYDSHKKSWIYLHRDRTQEQFERLHHNRSYTKSTKSRNNTSRKSRKQSNKSSSNDKAASPAEDTSTSSATTTTSAATSVTNTTTSPTVGVGAPAPETLSNADTQSTPVSTPVQTGKPPVTPTTPTQPTISQIPTTTVSSVQLTKPVVTTNLVPVPVTVKQEVKVEPTEVPKIVTELPKHANINEVLAAAASLAPTIRFTLPVSTANAVATGQMNMNAFQTTRVETQQTQARPQQHLILQQSNSSPPTGTGGITVLPAPTATPAQTHTPIVQTINTVAVSTTNQLNSSVTTQPVTVSTSMSQSIVNAAVNFPTGQLVIGPSALLRLGSLRLPEGVRFTQVRVPGAVTTTGLVSTGTAASSPIRLPHHRILFTRGSIPGQTQGLLLGQTATGQTVFLSANPGVGAVGSIQSIQAGTAQVTPLSVQSAGTTNSATGLSVTDHQTGRLTVGSISAAGNVLTASPTVVGQTQLIAHQQTSMSNSVTGTPSSVASSGATTATITVPASLLTAAASNAGGNQQSMSMSLMAAATGNSGAATLSGNPIQTVTMTNPTQNVVSQVQLQQQGTAAGQQTAQLTSPIIIRSNQGDFVIPGHISLGRGMQGIKVIPVPTGTGKQTVLARIMSPATTNSVPVTTTIAAQAVNNQSNQPQHQPPQQ